MTEDSNVYGEGIQYLYAETQVPETLVSQDYSAKYDMVNPLIHVVSEGERLVDISYRYYGNHNLWFLIAAFNRDKIINPLILEAGTELKFPQLSTISVL